MFLLSWGTPRLWTMTVFTFYLAWEAPVRILNLIGWVTRIDKISPACQVQKSSESAGWMRSFRKRLRALALSEQKRDMETHVVAQLTRSSALAHRWRTPLRTLGRKPRPLYTHFSSFSPNTPGQTRKRVPRRPVFLPKGIFFSLMWAWGQRSPALRAKGVIFGAFASAAEGKMRTEGSDPPSQSCPKVLRRRTAITFPFLSSLSCYDGCFCHLKRMDTELREVFLFETMNLPVSSLQTQDTSNVWKRQNSGGFKTNLLLAKEDGL